MADPARRRPPAPVGPGWRTVPAATGRDTTTLLRKATGRAPATAGKAAHLDRRGLRRLTLG